MSAAFRYSNPPVVHWGAGSLAELASELTGAGARRIGVVTTRSLVSDAVVSPRLERALAGLSVAARVTVRQHVPAADLEAGLEQLAAAGVQALVSVGGGSPIDAAKIFAVRLSGADGEQPPHVAVPTTLSAAELAAGAGMTDTAGDKVGIRDPRGLPDAVIYDPELALGTPLDLWLSTGIRAVDHAVEGFLAPGEHPFSDVMCLEGLRRLVATLPRARTAPGDVAVRGENQLGAWFSYTLPGPTAGGLSHMLGKQVGARYGIPHGVTSCILLPHVLAYRLGLQPERLQPLQAILGDAPGVGVARLVRELGLPERLRDFDVPEAELPAAAEAVAAVTGQPAPALLELYQAAR